MDPQEFGGPRIPNFELRDRLTACVSAAREQKLTCAILMVVLNRTDQIDAIFGTRNESIADAFLPSLEHILREGDLYAVLSGGKFCVILPGLKSRGQAELAASKICRVFQETPMSDGQLAKIRPSVGIACFPDHGTSAEQLAIKADAAARLASSRDAFHPIFAEARGVPSFYFGDLENQLLAAIDENQLKIHYQPKVHLKTGECVGVEALLRWNTPEHGAIPPDAVVSIAEERGLMGVLSKWIANTVLRHQAEWRAKRNMVPVSINVSTVNLTETDLPEVFEQMIGTWRADPSQITLEITETSTIVDAGYSLRILSRLKSLGIRLSVDDFGTGYSSLAYIKRFPLDELKVDKLFVQHLKTSNSDRAIVHSVIDLAHHFKLQVVAEGVEDLATMDELRTMGCDVAQGYLIGTPMSAESLQGWLSTHPLAS